MLDLAGADPERQRAEGAVGGGVRVAADDRHPRLGDPELGADHVDDPLAVGAERVDGDPELLAVALERLDLDARELVADPRGDRGPVGGHVVVGGGERAVGAADRAAGEAQAVEGLRAGDLVDEVQVDVDQAGGDLVGLPDLVEQALGHRSSLSARCRRPALTTASRTASLSPGFSKWWGRSASKVTQSPAAQLVAGAVADERRPRPDSHQRGLAAARLVHRRVAGAAGDRAGGQRVARELGALAGQRRGEDLVAVAAGAGRARCAARRARTTMTAPLLVEAQQLRQAQLQAVRDPGRDLQRRARLAALDLREHRRADARALRQVAQRQVHRLAQRADPGAERLGRGVAGSAQPPYKRTLSRTSDCARTVSRRAPDSLSPCDSGPMSSSSAAAACSARPG